ncbi:MAG: tyrosine-type recombinase/integrase [Deltaproteobacteria bacterium]|nr:tyrosine-type recombinase/integrase [Deltaproteobacteria bacterium]MBW2342963.1 tyrosine-type recombinase/integrase [Deltaproteobacteria bacterium]
MSVEQVNDLLKAASNIKHRALFMTVYGGGLRVSAVVRLKQHHIEGERMMIRVEQGKGKQDCYAILPCSIKLNQFYNRNSGTGLTHM